MNAIQDAQLKTRQKKHNFLNNFYKKDCHDVLKLMEKTLADFFQSNGYNRYVVKGSYYYIDPLTDIGVKFDFATFYDDNVLFCNQICLDLTYRITDKKFVWCNYSNLMDYCRKHDYNGVTQVSVVWNLSESPQMALNRLRKILTKRHLHHIPEIIKMQYTNDILIKQRKAKLISIKENNI